MNKRTQIKKRGTPEENANNQTLIMFLLLHTDTPKTLSELSNEIEQPTNLVFYHIQELKKKYLILEIPDKKYTCQSILKEDESEDLDSLMLVMIRILVNNLVLPEDISQKQLEKAVMANLKTYINIYEIEVT